MSKTVDVSHLPTKEFCGRTVIDWTASIGMTVTTAEGEAKITDFKPNSKPNLTVTFLETGGVAECLAYNFTRGEVKDRCKPIVYGVGFMGYGPHRGVRKLDGKSVKALEYTLWANILSRCYSPHNPRYNSYGGCSVCERWHNYQNFCDDLPALPGYEDWLAWKNSTGAEEIQLDKDTLFPGNKVYAPNTTQFISATLNKTLGAISRHNKERLNNETK